jgi:hypothetical protein
MTSPPRTGFFTVPTRRRTGGTGTFIQRYDVWLAGFDAKEAVEKPGPESTFDMGFADVRFPVAARDAFLNEYASLRKELYGEDAPNPSFQRTASEDL